ncbi:MAG: AbrB/MazE/SpoVT family DNA-binding domain-containing protein [Gammaproteobacteria bacterium]
MKVAIVRIGNSKGIRLPKAILEQCNLNHEADLAVRDGQVLIRPVHRVRAGWDAAFEAMRKAGDDALLDTNAKTMTAWDRSEWRW